MWTTAAGRTADLAHGRAFDHVMPFAPHASGVVAVDEPSTHSHMDVQVRLQLLDRVLLSGIPRLHRLRSIHPRWSVCVRSELSAHRVGASSSGNTAAA
eukprot:SAG31_NODE_20709_length_567_cov_0.989316_1_plen_97_part_10